MYHQSLRRKNGVLAAKPIKVTGIDRIVPFLFFSDLGCVRDSTRHPCRGQKLDAALRLLQQPSLFSSFQHESHQSYNAVSIVAIYSS